MAMLVAHNSSSALALGELNKNNSRLAKDLQKVSSGMKLNSAGDGAAEYSISEKMRVMVRSLGQDIDNSQKGIDIVKVAEGGIQQIIEELRTMKEMAINSANDHNSDADRATMQKEVPASVREHYNNLEHHADECVSCLGCESRCPFGVKVASRMTKTAELFA